jgi:MalT-like TPR region
MNGTVRRCLGMVGGWFLARAGAAGAYGAGMRYLERGDVAAAAEAFADAQRLWARELGPWHGAVVMAMAKRAACYVRLGRVHEGVRLYERAITLDRGLRGDASDRVRLLAVELAQARTLMPAPFEGESRGAAEPVVLA